MLNTAAVGKQHGWYNDDEHNKNNQDDEIEVTPSRQWLHRSWLLLKAEEIDHSMDRHDCKRYLKSMALKRFMLKSKAESTQQIFPVFLMVLPEISGQKKRAMDCPPLLKTHSQSEILLIRL